MHLHTRNINTAFRELVGGMVEGSIPAARQPSRAGEVLRITEPTLISYSHPRERVLLYPARNANPFFQLYEALWMLAGRQDVAPLAYYNPRMTRYSDDGVTLNGAYGYRWQHARSGPGHPGNTWYGGTIKDQRPEVNQLDLLVDYLQADPNGRRAVLTMWNVEDDLLKVGSSKDVCCNLNVMFELQDPDPNAYSHGQAMELSMTVTNRSNDLVWSTCAGDYVTFSILQEYLAAHLGVGVGPYHHFSNNLHAYLRVWEPQRWLGVAPMGYPPAPTPLVQNAEVFEHELLELVARHATDSIAGTYTEPFLRDVAQPLCITYHHWKRKERGRAQVALGGVVADDWRLAAASWLENRQQGQEGVQGSHAKD